jgi:ElaB/YqjD/DUF883 family membrane-anchored ribosome-binding protein
MKQSTTAGQSRVDCVSCTLEVGKLAEDLNMTGPEKVSTDKLFSDLQTVIEDAEALLQATASQTGEKIDAIRTRARASVHQARERLVAIQAKTADQARQAAESADEYVHKNPWQAVGIAAGIGLLLGVLISRR